MRLRRGVRYAAASAIAAAALAAIACGSERPAPAVFESKTPPGGAASDAGSVFGSDDTWTPGPPCSKETQYVYVIDAQGMLRRFDPPTLTFTLIGPIRCAGTPYSMAVDRSGVAWVLFTNGSLAVVDTRTAKCKRTAFDANKSGFAPLFGMGFSTNGDGGAEGETLFVSKQGLASLDLQTLTIKQLGLYDTLEGDTELTGTGDGRVFAVFEGSSQTTYIVAELDKKTARPLSEVTQPEIKASTTGASSLAFAFWGGDFYAFAGPGTYTDVYRYRPIEGTTVKVSTADFVIVGAGVSTCAPTTGVR